MAAVELVYSSPIPDQTLSTSLIASATTTAPQASFTRKIIMSVATIGNHKKKVTVKAAHNGYDGNELYKIDVYWACPDKMENVMMHVCIAKPDPDIRILVYI